MCYQNLEREDRAWIKRDMIPFHLSNESENCEMEQEKSLDFSYTDTVAYAMCISIF